MSKELTVVTDDTEAAWIKDFENTYASVGGRVIVKSATSCDAEAACSDVVIDFGEKENALSCIERCRRCSPQARILVAAFEPPWQDVREAYRAGASDVIPKSRIEKETLHAIMKLNEPAQRILLAENNKGLRDTWGELLRSEGYEVVMAGSPSEAAEKLELNDIDLAILDVRLEDDSDERDMSGLDVARKVPSPIPVIIVTNHPTSEIVRASMRRSLNGHQLAAEFICKREPEEIFLETVKKILPPSVDPSDARDEEIRRLYQKLSDLRVRGAGQADVDPEVEEKLQSTFERLKALQLEEAEEFRAAAEDRLLMPLNAGREILAKVNHLLNEP